VPFAATTFGFWHRRSSGFGDKPSPIAEHSGHNQRTLVGGMPDTPGYFAAAESLVALQFLSDSERPGPSRKASAVGHLAALFE
jgi:hypothetical protein